MGMKTILILWISCFGWSVTLANDELCEGYILKLRPHLVAAIKVYSGPDAASQSLKKILNDCLKEPSLDCLEKAKKRIKSAFEANIKPRSRNFREEVHQFFLFVDSHEELCKASEIIPKPEVLRTNPLQNQTRSAQLSALFRKSQDLEKQLQSSSVELRDLKEKVDLAIKAIALGGIALALLILSGTFFFYFRINSKLKNVMNQIGFNHVNLDKFLRKSETEATHKAPNFQDFLAGGEFKKFMLDFLQDQKFRKELSLIFTETAEVKIGKDGATEIERYLDKLEDKETELSDTAENRVPLEPAAYEQLYIEKLYAQPPAMESLQFTSISPVSGSKNIFCLEVMEGGNKAIYYPAGEENHLKKAIKNYDPILKRACHLKNIPDEKKRRIKLIEAGTASRVGNYWEIEKLATIKFIV